MNRYRVPKRRVPVRFTLPHQPEECAHLFLGELAETHTGPERPSDVLNRPEVFIALQTGSGGVEVLCRDALSFLAVAAELENDPEQPPDPGDETRVQLSIEMDDGREVEGVARYRLPESARRLQDFLNQQDGFVRLECQQEVLLVNKRRIQRVRERSASQAGAA
jgi:hypothetical protein